MMTAFRLPNAMPETDKGRLPEGKRAYENGKTTVDDPHGDCEQTIHINLFFDGTNNNDDIKTPARWRDSTHKTHTNVARLFRACPTRPQQGIFSSYIAGVGTLFPDLGEHTYSSSGKAFASGFAKRCAWGYARVLNAAHEAMIGMRGDDLINGDEAKKICEKLDWNLGSSLLTTKEKHLGSLHESLVQQCKRNRLVKKAYINVFGFSRGAAGARVFVSKLINYWAKAGKLAGKIDYEVNFMGLFDTVASVGPPESFQSAVALEYFDGHFWAAGGGALNIPAQVRRCVHFFSMHEQRMSFPLDTIRKGTSYPAGDSKLLEVPYPGVHSDVGGSYVPGDQGKSVKGEGHRLGKIPLHDMYVEALKSGVPLTLDDKGTANQMDADSLADFAIDPAVAKAFNDWRAALPAMDGVEKALEFGLRQSLQWRTLRARWHTGTYVTNQEFYRYCAEPANKREDSKTPQQLRTEVDKTKKADPVIRKLEQENIQLKLQVQQLRDRAMFPQTTSQVMADLTKRRALEAKVAANDAAIAARENALMAEAVGKDPADCRPGEGADEFVTNDRTDLLEAAEEFQLLLGYLHPELQPGLNVRKEMMARPVFSPIGAAEGVAKGFRYLATPRAERPRTDSKLLVMVDDDILTKSAAVRGYWPIDDVLVEPAPEMIPYLKATTSAKAVDDFALGEKAAIELFDNYIHDSRAWFRVPNFHEYAPGGYGWARTFFVGDNKAVRHLGMRAKGVLDKLQDTALAVEHEIDAAKDRAIRAAGDAAGRAADAARDAVIDQGKRAMERVIPSGFPMPRL
ncbi:T6SS phospholipase effector Tle1-like catalytic domain-containing protein [Cupriavidus sp. TMH.W2]|uniref:T6SS phospholipase effector Tle1-like catalytic domain-containing protein n=1 Tax=Cupriavidus sp. TMH.W2 TaxID=3434465 RepID=UPI003D7845FB